jgi:hypothetical protein
VRATVKLTDKLLRFSMRTRQRVFDQIAAVFLPPSKKLALVERATKRVALARSRVQAQLGRRSGTVGDQPRPPFVIVQRIESP